MGKRLRHGISTALAALLLSIPAHAQTLPNHADPSAREIVPNLASLSSLRFLTTADFPPFNYRDTNGELIGFNVDLARAICEITDVACTIQAWPWDQAADALADNQGDALIAGLDLSPDNGARFDFSSVYLALPGRFVAPLDAVQGFDPARLGEQTIAVRRGSAHEHFLERYFPQSPRAPFESELEALEAVKSGDAAVFFGDAMRAAFWLNQNLDCCGFAGDAYFRPNLFGEGFAVAVQAGQDTARHAIDWALVKLKDDGTLDELYLRWFPVGFY